MRVRMSPPLWLSLVLCLAALTVCDGSTLVRDCAVLQSLYNATQGSRWTDNSGWTTDDGATTCCTWYGVSCDKVDGSDRVVSVDLHGNGLNGTLPNELGDLTAVINFTVGYDTMTQASNFLWGTLPASLSALTSLQTLDMSHGALSGSLPDAWSALSSLQMLSVYGNRLESSLPSVWGSGLKQLRQCSLDSNRLSGTLPGEWGGLESLQYLSIHNNRFHGSVPRAWRSWRQIQTLVLSENGLSGTLPREWSEWGPSLDELYFSGNRFSGQLPPEWGNWTGISVLFGDHVRLSGSLSPQWAGMQNLAYLQLSHTGVSGSLPTEWSALTGLYFLFLNDNFLNGSLPTEWGAWDSISTITLSDNYLSGTLPSEWSRMAPSLSSLYLSNNILTGSLPEEWGAWDNMIVLALFGNALNGSLAQSWGGMKELQRIFLNDNALLGPIPSTWSSLPKIQTVDLHGNFLTGEVNLCAASLTSLAVHRNRFTHVADCMATTAISSLDLQYNPLVAFPKALGSSTNLAVLDMRNCNLNFSLHDFPLGSDSVPVLRIGQNPLISGDIGALLNGGEVSAYIEMDLSNTNVHGSLSQLDPIRWINMDFTPWPLENLQQFNVAMNPHINGSLPLSWFHYASDNNLDLLLNVTGVENLCALCDVPLPHSCDDIVDFTNATLPFDCDAAPVAYTDSSYVCQPLLWPPGVKLFGLDAAYFQYRTCSCAPGHSGSPPHCYLSSNRAEVLGLAIPFALLACLAAVVTWRQVRRWRIWRRDFRRAHELLKDYVHVSGTSAATATTIPLIPRAQISDDWIIPRDDVRIVKTIASGAQGRVSMAVWNHTAVAYKEFFAFTEEDQESLLGEAAMHVQLRHPNIVQLLGVCLDPPSTITEWMERGSLFGIISAAPHSLPERHQVALDIAKGMLYLHSKGIIHRDLKSLNVMLDARGTAKVGDFGNARKSATDATMTMGMGTAHWMAPEVFDGGRYSEKCDVYSFGIILWELCALDQPFKDMHFPLEIGNLVCAGTRPETAHICTPENATLLSLMQRCWQQEPALRPPFKTIVCELETAVARHRGLLPPPKLLP